MSRFFSRIAWSNLFFKNENIEDSNEFDVKKFICKSLLERSSILDEIFETVISSKNCKTLQAYEVIKINKDAKTIDVRNVQTGEEYKESYGKSIYTNHT